MTPEQQQQFNAELQMVIAVAAQIRSSYDRADSAVLGAMELIQAAEKLLKGHYEPTEQKAPEPVAPAPVAPEVRTRPKRQVIDLAIDKYKDVILGKSLRTFEELKALVTAYGVTKSAQLSDEQAEGLLEQLRQICK